MTNDEKDEAQVELNKMLQRMSSDIASQFTEEDFFNKEKLRKSGVTIIETWRRGAEELTREMLRKKLTKK